MNINPNNNQHLKVGEKVICVKDVSFSDGTTHNIDPQPFYEEGY